METNQIKRTLKNCTISGSVNISEVNNRRLISLYDYSKKMIEFYGDNAKVGLCFVIATFFKDIIAAKTDRFPILNLAGELSSKRIAMEYTLQSFFYPNAKYISINHLNISSIKEAISATNNSLVVMDGYDNDLNLIKREFLKTLYDGIYYRRYSRFMEYKKARRTQVGSGIVISGKNEATADISLFSRFIFLFFEKTGLSEQEKVICNELGEMGCKDLTHIQYQILLLREMMETYFDENLTHSIQDLKDELFRQGAKVKDRILYNWSILLASFQTISIELSLPFCYTELLEIFSKFMICQSEKIKNI